MNGASERLGSRMATIYALPNTFFHRNLSPRLVSLQGMPTQPHNQANEDSGNTRLNNVLFITHTFSGIEGTRTTGAVTDFTGRLNALFSMYNEQAESQDRNMVERLKGEADGMLHAVR
jgi:hypothetical protein